MKFIKEITDEIIECVRIGNYITVAAQACNVDETTIYKWIKEGEQGKDKEKIEFSNAIKRARAEAEMRNVKIIKEAALETWQAAAWWLERTNYNRWGRKDRHEVMGKDGEEIKYTVEIKPIGKKNRSKSN